MNTRFLVILAGLVALPGCTRKQATPVGPAAFAPLNAEPTAPNSKLIVTPERVLSGQVVKVNLAGRYVVLTFPIGHLPTVEQRLNVYRAGLKVGEVTVTAMQLDDNVVADLVDGTAEPADEVRDK